MNFSQFKKAFTLRPVFSETLILLFLFGLALFFRFHRITEFPEGLGEVWSDTFTTLALLLRDLPLPPESAQWNLLSYTLLPLGTLVTLLAFSLFGVSQMSMVALPLLASALGAPLSYFVFREMFSKEVGFLTGTFLAVSYWDVSVIRVSAAGPASAFDGPLMMAFLWSAYRLTRRPSLSLWRLTGALFALMLFNGNWHLAGSAFLIAAAFLGLRRLQGSWRGTLVAARWFFGLYLLLLLVAGRFLKVPNPADFPLSSFKFYLLQRTHQEVKAHVSIHQNIKKLTKDLFVEGERDPYRAGWPISGEPWLPSLLSLALAVALVAPPSLRHAFPGRRLLLLWLLIPTGIFVLFFTLHAHHFLMMVPAILAVSALGLSLVADWIKRASGRFGKPLAAFTCGAVFLILALDSYQILFRDLPLLRDRAYPVERLSQLLAERGVGQESLLVSSLPSEMEWELRAHSNFALSHPALKTETAAGWPLPWESLAFEKGWKRIAYLHQAIVWQYYRDFRERFRLGNVPESELYRIFYRYFGKTREGDFWMARSFPPEKVHTLYFRNGDPAFFVVEVLSKEARRGHLTPTERRTILAEIPQPSFHAPNAP